MHVFQGLILGEMFSFYPILALCFHTHSYLSLHSYFLYNINLPKFIGNLQSCKKIMAERKKSSQIRQDQKPLIFVSTSVLTAMAELMFLGGRLCSTLSLHNFEIVMFPNFLRSKVCSRFAAHKVPRIQSLLY